MVRILKRKKITIGIFPSNTYNEDRLILKKKKKDFWTNRRCWYMTGDTKTFTQYFVYTQMDKYDDD